VGLHLAACSTHGAGWCIAPWWGR
jgi:hypothetical protein